MKKVALLILIAIVFLIACQPVPEKEIIINNNQDYLKPLSSPEQANTDWQLNVPQKWVEDISPIDKFNIKVHSEIEASKTNQFSIANVYIQKFSDEKMKSVIDYFCKDKKMFYWPSVRTKAQLEKELVEYKRGMLVDDEYIPPDPDDPYIKELEEKIKNAPTDNKRKYYAAEGGFTEEFQNSKFTLGVELENNRDGIIMIDNPANGEYDSVIVVDFGGNFLNENELAMNDLKIGEILISEDEAIKTGEEILNDLGIDFVKLSKIDKYRILRSGNLEGAFSSYESSGYMLSYSREYNGLHTPDMTENGVYVPNDLSVQGYLPEYSAPWYQETISIYIDENGVQRFSWYGYCRLGETIQENVQLLEFDKIKEIASNQLFYQNSAYLMDDAVRTVDVNKVMLGLSLINKRNVPKEGILVPAWYFIYKVSQSNSANPETDDVLKDVGVLVINAIDGSVINPFPAR